MIQLIIAAVMVAILAATGGLGYYLGQKTERADWETKEKGRIYAQGIELRNAMQHIADERQANEIYNARIQNEYQVKINTLTRDLVESHRLRLSVEKPRCDNNPVPRIAGSGKVRDDPAGQSGIRDKGAIPEALYIASEDSLNTGINSIWEEQQRLKLWAEQLLARCAPRFDVRG